jgi:hypothetical protein
MLQVKPQSHGSSVLFSILVGCQSLFSFGMSATPGLGSSWKISGTTALVFCSGEEAEYKQLVFVQRFDIAGTMHCRQDEPTESARSRSMVFLSSC